VPPHCAGCPTRFAVASTQAAAAVAGCVVALTRGRVGVGWSVAGSVVEEAGGIESKVIGVMVAPQALKATEPVTAAPSHAQRRLRPGGTRSVGRARSAAGGRFAVGIGLVSFLGMRAFIPLVSSCSGSADHGR
jgi:hypothetical protein